MKEDIDENQDQCTMQNVKDNVDFWKDAGEFLESQLPKDFRDKMIVFFESKEYKQNDVRLFKSMLQECIGFEVTTVLLEHYC